MTLSGSSSSPACQHPGAHTRPHLLCRPAGGRVFQLDSPTRVLATPLSMVALIAQQHACEHSPWCCAGRESLAHRPPAQQRQHQHNTKSPDLGYIGHGSESSAPCRLLICGSGEQGQAPLAGALLHPLRDAGVCTLTLPSLIVAGQGDVVQGMVRALKQACEG